MSGSGGRQLSGRTTYKHHGNVRVVLTVQMSVLAQSHNSRIGNRGFVATVDVSSVIPKFMFAATYRNCRKYTAIMHGTI